MKQHLLSFGYDRLKQTGEGNSRKRTNNKWFETQDSISYWDDFFKPKIVWKRIGSIIRFSYDEKGIYCLDSTCIATGGNFLKYIVAVLNSKLGHYLLKESPRTGTGDLIISVQAIDPIFVPKINDELNNLFISLIDKMTETQVNNESKLDLDDAINKVIYEVYNFSKDEAQFIDNQDYTM